MKLYLKVMAMLYELEGAGLVLDKNVPVCLIQTVPEKWGCIDHTCIFFFSTLGGHGKDNGRLVSIFCLLLAHIQRHRYVVKK